MASPGCKVKKNNSFLIADICYVSFAFQHDTHPQKARRFDHFEFEKVSFFIVGYAVLTCDMGDLILGLLNKASLLNNLKMLTSSLSLVNKKTKRVLLLIGGRLFLFLNWVHESLAENLI